MLAWLARLGVTLIGGTFAILVTVQYARIIERNVVVYRRGWIFIVSGFFEPFFYLLSAGVGLGHLVGPLHVAPGYTVRYAVFAATGGVTMIRRVWVTIWTDWLPKSTIKLAQSKPMLEWYPEDWVRSGDFEIWVPIE